MTEETLLKVEDLKQYFRLGKTQLKAVDGVSFDVKKGEVFALVGESGSGKTTTGRAIIGLHEITDGKIWFHGKRIGTGNKKRPVFTKSIQMIFQDPVTSLNPRMTVGEIVAEGLIVSGIKDKAYVREKVAQTLKEVGLLPEYASRYPHEFSGGQRQRIGIARAVIMRPELIIADEPVSALDVSVQAQVLNLLSSLRERMGLTVLFIAHDLSVVKCFSDRIAVMYLGKIVEIAPSDELFARPLHAYTKALLSAIPLPDPDYESKRKRSVYSLTDEEKRLNAIRKMKEVFSGHFVYCTPNEEESFLREYAKKSN
ncbi:MAG: ABC transporter ATP-binding protein [Clostridia bacterium]|nr:ABC transporter ATP-binding protein [Clostridia bacterium]